MKQTNLYVNDMLDFDLSERAGDVLWKACTPINAYEAGDAVILETPFKAQLTGSVLLDDGSCLPDDNTDIKVFNVVIRAYGDSVVRLTVAFDSDIPGDESIMFEWDESIKPESLKVIEKDKKWEIVDKNGVVRFKTGKKEWKTRAWNRYSSEGWYEWLDSIPKPTDTFCAAVIPDGKTEIPFTEYDTFFPTLHYSIGLGYVDRTNASNTCVFSLQAGYDEKFAGTGERFANMDLAGRTLLLENVDAHGVNSRQAYKNVPFYVSNRPYGLLIHTPASVRLSLADISTKASQAAVEDKILDLFFIGGDSLERVIYNYRRITGFPRKPPLWSFGSWISRCSYHSAEETLEVARKLRNGRFPFEVIHLDPGWFDRFWKCDWKFSNNRFSNPEKYFSLMKAMGFRVCLWNFPTVEKDTVIYEEACNKGYLPVRKNANGEITCGSSIDFTNPEAVLWYKGMLKELLKMGASVIKTDFGEIIDQNAEYHNMQADQLHNLYALLYQKAAFEAVDEVNGEGLIWARAGWIGCQRYPVHWGGDCVATWDGLAGSIKGGLHLGLSGYAFWSHDVSGFVGMPDIMNVWPSSNLYVRWTQVGVFTSHIRYHGCQPREPYEYPEVSQIVRKWLQLRYALIPYLVDESNKAIKTGYPILRAMVFHHEKDKMCWSITDQFYFGDSFLVAPIINEQSIRDVYLPEGKWIDYWTGASLQGPVTLYGVKMPLDMIPVYVKYDSSIKVYPDVVQCTDEMDMSRIIELKFDSSYKGLSESVLNGVFS